MAVESGSVRAFAAALLLLVACGDSMESGSPDHDGGDDDDTVTEPDEPSDEPSSDPDDDDPIDQPPLVDEEGCPILFAQDLMPEWRVTLSDEEWAALEYEFYHREQREDAGLDPTPYHPVEMITYDDGSGPVEVSQVLIRLKGQSSWDQTIQFDEYPKMQFVLAFNEVNPDLRFRGVRKVELDMPRTDWTFLRQRLGLHTMRRAGQTAQCANNAILHLNGEYYGLYTHLERLDKEFLQRVYGKANGADEGDLWKAGYEIRTNEEDYSTARIDALWSATSSAEVSALADLDDAAYEWASEAVLPHSDGYYMGRPNFFLYDHPHRGFLWIPSDVDTAFDYYPYFLDLAFPRTSWREYWYWIPYATVLGEATGMNRYVDAIDTAHGGVDPVAQVALVDAWASQIAAAAEADPHRSFTIPQHRGALDQMREYLHLRHAFVADWVTCRRTGTGNVDRDQDGTVFCFDCNEENAAVHPGQIETCNQRDDDCDGFADEACQPEQ